MSDTRISQETAAAALDGTEQFSSVQGGANVKITAAQIATYVDAHLATAPYAIGDLFYASSTSAIARLADIATGNALISGGVGAAPAWGKIALTTHVSGVLHEANGGTNQSTYAVGDLLQATASNVLGKLAAVATGNALISGGVATASAWGKIGLTTHVSGVLPEANGGTNQSAYTTGDMLYASAANVLSKLAAVAVGSILIAGGVGTAPAWSATPTLTTSLTVPLLIGGTGAGSTQTFKTTTGTGSGDAFIWVRGTNGASEAMRLNATGLGIGNAAPNSKLTVGNANLSAYATHPGLILLSSAPGNLAAANSGLEFITSTFGSGYGWKIDSCDTGSGVELLMGTRQNAATWTEMARFNSAGSFAIGNTSPGGKFHVSSDAELYSLFETAVAGSAGSNILFRKARGTQASKTIVGSGDTLGQFLGQGYDGAAYQSAALILFAVDTTPGANDMPGRISFWTTPDGSTTAVERGRVRNTGALIWGNATGTPVLSGGGEIAAFQGFIAVGTPSTGPAFLLGDTGAGTAIIGGLTNHNVTFRANNTDYLTLTTVGNLKLGGTASRGTTEGTNQYVLFNGTTPAGTLANGVSIYSAAGVLTAMDAAGIVTTLCPSIKSASPTAGVGYATGAGGTVTQLTSKATGVTLSTVTGAITTHNATLNAATIVSFVLTSTAIAATDVLILNHISGGTPGSYTLNARAGAGSATIDIRNNTAGNLGEAIVIEFAVIKGVTS